MKKKSIKSRKTIRNEIRRIRRNVPENYRRHASFKVSTLFSELPEYQVAEKIAGFLPFDGEADPVPLMERAMQEGKQIYLPVLTAKGQPMKFASYETRSDHPTAMKKNWLGIEEPDVPEADWVECSEPDLVITPLVAFDEQCNRIGVGGGFYDRTFEFLRSENSRTTHLFGLAFDLQKIESIKTEAWDVRLDGVVTEVGVYRP